MAVSLQLSAGLYSKSLENSQISRLKQEEQDEIILGGSG